MHRVLIVITAGSLAVPAVAPAPAAAKGCGAVKVNGGQTEIEDTATTRGSCAAATRVARKFARTRVAPDGYRCKEKFTRRNPPAKANVACSGKERRITFKVTWNGSMPLPAAPAPPSAAGG